MNHRFLKLVLFGVLVGILGLATSQIHTFDIFWQLQSGKYMVESGEFIRRDLFSLAADAVRWEHCWLHDLIMYGVQSVAGYQGLSVAKGVLVTLTFSLLVWTARLRRSSWLSIALVSVPAYLYTWATWLERPQIWTFFFTALFVWLVQAALQRDLRWLLGLPVVMLFWANLHAGSVLAFALLAAFLVGELGNLAMGRSCWNWRDYRWLWIALIGVALAAVCTPYGSQLFKALQNIPQLGASSGLVAQVHNMDWRETTFASYPWFYYLVAVGLLLLARDFRKVSLADVCLLGGFALMGLKLDRHLPFYYLGFAAIMPVYFDRAGRWLGGKLPSRWLQPVCYGLAVVAVLVSGYHARTVYRYNGFFNAGLRAWHYPVEAADFVLQQNLPGNLYNTYDWGGYLMWRLFPGHLVFWDGRSDSLTMFQEGLQVMNAKPGWEEVLDRNEVNTIVTKACTVDTGQRYPLLDALRNSGDWALVFNDESSLVFVRRQAVLAQWLRALELSKDRIDDTIWSEASLLLQSGPGRYKAFLEMGLIAMKRKNIPTAVKALGLYLRHTPVRDPQAEKYYAMLKTQLPQSSFR